MVNFTTLLKYIYKLMGGGRKKKHHIVLNRLTLHHYAADYVSAFTTYMLPSY